MKGLMLAATVCGLAGFFGCRRILGHSVEPRRFLPRVVCLEERLVCDATIFDDFGFLIETKSDAVASAGQFPTLLLDGVPAPEAADQIRILFDLTGTFDFRQLLVFDRNWMARMRHFDLSEPPGSEDPFGTSFTGPLFILADGLGGETFYLGTDLLSVNIITDGAPQGRLSFVMTGRPSDGPTAGPHSTAPILLQWRVDLFPPLAERTIVEIDSSILFEESVSLSSARIDDEAFRVFAFASSAVPDSHTTPPLGATHDANQWIVAARNGTELSRLDLLALSANTLAYPGGLSFDGWVGLNQTIVAPLNGDPPSFRANLISCSGESEHRAQAYKTVVGSTNENSDNMAAWINRYFVSPEIPAGTEYHYKLAVIAQDEPFTGGRPLTRPVCQSERPLPRAVRSFVSSLTTDAPPTGELVTLPAIPASAPATTSQTQLAEALVRLIRQKKTELIDRFFEEFGRLR